MLKALTLILLFQLAGETITLLCGLPIPGPVIGMALLFAALLWRGRKHQNIPLPLRQTAQQLLQHLSLLFVPAGVGVMLHIERITHEWLPITLALVGSTLAAIVVTAWVLQRGMRGHEQIEPGESS
ncbi:CidA/LrgA family protein [Parvibium lacunae]|uniref:CidA/LrgA family protein n=1 Tax=Parvibium lacunae TaxID=1888893 RepID=A0A368L1Y8_9BURK|nr:CidA/LrgA family protein [Parvibium lacunae]RCS57122.1 CidA/LrgA family protein [Parvibium lacunae]